MLADQVVMMPFARTKWNALSEDARATLEAAFTYGIARPAFVSRHRSYFRRINGRTVEFNHFKIGYATFVIALVNNIPPEILWDFSLEDGLSMFDSARTLDL